MKAIKALTIRIRGWFPKEQQLKEHAAAMPVTVKVNVEQEEILTKKLIRAIAITNPIIGSIIVASNFSYSSLNLATATWAFAESALVLLPTNVLIYLYLRNRIKGRGV